MTENILSLRDVHADIGAYKVLHGVDFEVPHGLCTVLLGRNGAGKTTTLRTIMGLWRPSGSIVFSGWEIAGLSTPFIARLGIAYVPERMGIFSDLTVKQNMVVAARSARSFAEIDARRLEWILDLFPPLRKFWMSPAGRLSGGQKQMLSIARAIIEPRSLLLIDEPTKGLAPSIVDVIADILIQLKQAGTTILLVEQNVEFAERIGDRVAVIEDGRIAYRGTMGDFSADGMLQHSLLALAV